MNRWIERGWRRGIRRLGATGVIALLLIVPLSAATLWRAHLARDVATRQSVVERRTAELARVVLNPTKPAPTSAEQLARFGSTFPPLSQSADDLGRIFDAAAERAVPLMKGEYQLKADPSAAVVLYTATFPVHGSYAAIKGFSVDVLKTLPHASLDELHISRDNVESTSLDAVIRFTLIYRSR